MSRNGNLFFFQCTVSVDLFGVTAEAGGQTLPRAGGTSWERLGGLDALGEAARGFNQAVAWEDIKRQGCHWFTSDGPVEVFWGDAGPPRAA